jgi:hypothetical protein
MKRWQSVVDACRQSKCQHRSSRHCIATQAQAHSHHPFCPRLHGEHRITAIACSASSSGGSLTSCSNLTRTRFSSMLLAVIFPGPYGCTVRRLMFRGFQKFRSRPISERVHLARVGRNRVQKWVTPISAWAVCVSSLIWRPTWVICGHARLCLRLQRLTDEWIPLQGGQGHVHIQVSFKPAEVRAFLLLKSALLTDSTERTSYY